MQEITEEIKTYIRENYYYNPETGDLWRNYKKLSKCLGYKHYSGYLLVDILQKTYMHHRICWFLYYGEFPENEIDHIDRVRDNNKIENLREATDQQNASNKSKQISNTSGNAGVHWHKANSKWVARIGYQNKRLYLGSFSTLEEASVAYQKKATELFGEFNPYKL